MVHEAAAVGDLRDVEKIVVQIPLNVTPLDAELPTDSEFHIQI
jgi:hypothetical protein